VKTHPIPTMNCLLMADPLAGYRNTEPAPTVSSPIFCFPLGKHSNFHTLYLHLECVQGEALPVLVDLHLKFSMVQAKLKLVSSLVPV
jgi:hypothetical protein